MTERREGRCRFPGEAPEQIKQGEDEGPTRNIHAILLIGLGVTRGGRGRRSRWRL
jgi:hypothetical protein